MLNTYIIENVRVTNITVAFLYVLSLKISEEVIFFFLITFDLKINLEYY